MAATYDARPSPEAYEPRAGPQRPSGARRTVRIRGQVAPPAPAVSVAALREAPIERPEPLGLAVLTPAGGSSRSVRPRPDVTLTRLGQPCRGDHSGARRRAEASARVPTATGGTAGPDRAMTLHRDRRPPRPFARALASSPDLLAMWAVVMGIFLVLVAALSAHS